MALLIDVNANGIIELLLFTFRVESNWAPRPFKSNIRRLRTNRVSKHSDKMAPEIRKNKQTKIIKRVKYSLVLPLVSYFRSRPSQSECVWKKERRKEEPLFCCAEIIRRPKKEKEFVMKRTQFSFCRQLTTGNNNEMNLWSYPHRVNGKNLKQMAFLFSFFKLYIVTSLYSLRLDIRIRWKDFYYPPFHSFHSFKFGHQFRIAEPNEKENYT